MTKNILIIAAVLLPSTLLADELKDSAPLAATAKAELKAKSGSKVKGFVQFTESTDGLQVRYKISGLEKNKHLGFHIHEKGDCSSLDGKSAGPHYKKLETGGGTSKDNPDRYAGDMQEIVSDNKGNAEGVTMLAAGGLDKLMAVKDHAIIIHGGPDDVTKPSTPRIACGVITEQKAH